MAQKSVGQIVGTLAGAVIGSFVPGSYVALGASIGGMVGGLIDPPKSQTSGPRISDLSVQTTGYGNPLPRIYGQMATYGTVFWVDGNKIHEVGKTSSAGKGGGSKYTSYKYDATFAVSLADCDAPGNEIAGIRRIWISGKLVFDGFATSTAAILQSDDFYPTFTLYRGGIDQPPDPRVQADLGIANTPAWRGMAYIVFNNLPLEDFGNSLMGAQVKVEIITTAINDAWQDQVVRDEDMPVNFTTTGGYITGINAGVVDVAVFNSATTYRYAIETGDLLGVTSDKVMVEEKPPSLGAYLDTWYNLGRAANGGYLYLKVQTVADDKYYRCVIGYGPLIYKASGADHIDIQGEIISQNIELERVAAGKSDIWWVSKCCFNKGNNEIFVQTTDGDWYVIDLDGNIIEAHTATMTVVHSADIVVGSYARASYGFSMAFDFSVRRLVFFSENALHVYIAGANGVITSEYVRGWSSVNVIGSASTRSAGAVFIDGNIIAMACLNSYQVVSYGAITATPITHGEIVETECLRSKLLTTSDLDVSELTDDVRGYKVGQPGAIRSSLEPTRKAWPFDVVPSGYKLKFPRRGKTSLLTIPASNLILADGGGSVLSIQREMDTQLPRQIEATYIDVAREYDTNKQVAKRLNTDSINAVQVEFPVVFSDQEAARAAEVLLYAAWLERDDLTFILPPIYAQLEPSDVVTITTAYADHEVRIVGINYLPDGRLECSAKPNSAPVYTSTALGASGTYTGQTLSLAGPCDLLLLDIPCVDATRMNATGLLVGLSPYLAGWRGGDIIRSTDAGNSWDAVQSIAAPGTIAGVAVNALPVGVTHIIDPINTISAVFHGGMPVSVTPSALAAGANHFAVGAHGRWEIVAAQTVVDLGDNQATLSNLMRGRFGTEWAMSQHAAFDAIVLLDSASLRFVALNPSAINSAQLWRGVSNGQNFESVPESSLTYEAVNLKPLAPIRLRGHANSGSFDWTIEWERRSRTPVEPFSGVPTPLGETTESYVVEIWDSSYATLKRTIAGVTSESATWTYAQQIEDFGSEQTEVFARVYQISSVAGRGYALQGYLQHNVLADLLFSNVVLLMHMNGADGGTTFTDEKGKSVTVYGNAQTSTTQSKFNGSACKLDGTGDYLGLAASSDFDFGAGDFTWECWIYQVAVMTGTYADAIWCSQAGPVGFAVAIFSDGKIGITADSPAGGDWDIRKGCDPGDPRGSTAITLGTWAHIAVSRSGSNWYGFVNGAVDQTFTSSASISNAGSGYFLGHWHDGNARCFNGYIADLRITKGACRYTSAFTPPAVPFPNS
jgi:hypothetical protein